MTVEKLDCVVVGAGVVGLSVARALALAGREVVVLESESRVGMHASSRNSEVIHAGLYYPDDSLKARLCVQGRDMLYGYCNEHKIACDKLGKLVVATNEDEIPRLQAIAQQARANGVDDLRFVTDTEARLLEPNVVCASALLSPSTGIVDSHGLMLAMQGELEDHGGAVVLESRAENLRDVDGSLEFECGGDRFACNTLVNCGGLWARDLAAGLAEGGADWLPERWYAKGHYFAYEGKAPFRHLVYPLPIDGGLGVHATLDLAGAVRFGPDVEWLDRVDYDFDESRKPNFVEAIRRYFPDLDESRLVPAYTGVRAKLAGPGRPFMDFLVQTEGQHGIPGLINLFGIDSPGLTASLALGEYVAEVVA